MPFFFSLQVDLWTIPRDADECTIALIHANKQDELIKELSESNIALKIKHESVEDYLNAVNYTDINTDYAEYKQPCQPPPPSAPVLPLSQTLSRSIFGRYLTYSEMTNLLGKWSESKKFQLTTIGRSYENRNIYAVTFNKTGIWRSKLKPQSVIIECGNHAREWISPAICLYLIHNFMHNSAMKTYLNKYRVHLIPLLNPDGYVHSWRRGERLWRKNRSIGKNVKCAGVDLNRNFDVDFCRAGSDKQSCSEIYCGPRAFSEPESEAFRDFAITAHRNAPIQIYLSVHSYGQTISYPFGYSKKLKLPHANKLHRIAKIASHKIRLANKAIYKFGQTASLLCKCECYRRKFNLTINLNQQLLSFADESSGGSDDWVQVQFRPKAVFVIESRDRGNDNFLLSPNKIIPAGEDALIFLQTIFDHLEQSLW